MTGHSIAWTLDPAGWVNAAITCHEPDGAPCRTTCAAGGCEEPCDHPRKPLDYCNVKDWIDESVASECFAGPGGTTIRDGAIEPIWADDHYDWRYAEEVAP